MEKESWHLDRRVPIALIITLIVQFGGAVWWVAKKDEADIYRDARIAKLELQAVESAHTQQAIAERLARMDEKMGSVVDSLKRIEGRMDGERR